MDFLKNLIVVCGGSYGRQLYATVKIINKYSEEHGKERPYNVIGFIDDNPHVLDGTEVDVPIIGKISDWKPVGNEVYAIGAAFGKTKKKIAEMLKARGCKFETLISPQTIMCDDIIIGEGCYISAYFVSAGVKLGDFVNINGSMICPGAEIGNYSTTTGFTVVENAKIGEGVFLGSHSVICSGVTVGDMAKVSVGSIVINDVKSETTVFGVPAMEIG